MPYGILSPLCGNRSCEAMPFAQKKAAQHHLIFFFQSIVLVVWWGDISFFGFILIVIPFFWVQWINAIKNFTPILILDDGGNHEDAIIQMN